MSRASALVLLALAACTDASAPPSPAPVEASPARVEPPAEAPAAQGSAAPAARDDEASSLAALLRFASEHRAVEPSTRAELEPLVDAALAWVARASGAEDLPRTRGAEGARVLEIGRDAAFDRVVGRIVVVDGSVRVDQAEDAIVVASEIAFVRECRGCAVIAGRHVIVRDAAPDGAGTRALAWSADKLTIDDASGMVVAGPGAKDVVTRRGVIRADPRVLGETPLPPAPEAPALAIRRAEPLEGAPPAVLVRPASSTEEQRVRTGQSVRADADAWQLVQILDHAAVLRRDDALALVRFTE